jgi:hypothetical protein
LFRRSDFVHNRFRYYNPELGRYLNADPIGQIQGGDASLYVPWSLADLEIPARALISDPRDLAYTHTYGYDAVYRLTSRSQDVAGLGLPQSESFGYDPAGNRDDDPANPTPWAYDANNRLQASPGYPSYAFDADALLLTRGTSRWPVDRVQYNVLEHRDRIRIARVHEDVIGHQEIAHLGHSLAQVGELVRLRLRISQRVRISQIRTGGYLFDLKLASRDLVEILLALPAEFPLEMRRRPEVRLGRFGPRNDQRRCEGPPHAVHQGDRGRSLALGLLKCNRDGLRYPEFDLAVARDGEAEGPFACPDLGVGHGGAEHGEEHDGGSR